MGKNQIKLSWQDNKGWKKSIGKHQGKNGKPQYRMWYLGMDKSIAEDLAEYITLEWKQLKKTGATVWTPEALTRIADYKNAPTGSSAEVNTEAVPTSSINGRPKSAIKTYYQAIDYYCSHVVPNQSVTRQWKRDLIQRTETLKGALDDLTLRSIGPEELLKIVNYYKNRPRNKNKRNRPISIRYAHTLIGTAKRLFEWLYENELWEIPRGFSRIFRVEKTDFRLTESDRIRIIAGKKTFSKEELTKLYQNANPQVKGYMTLALNCGFTQSEINSLIRGEVFLDEPMPYIKRIRGKVREQAAIGKWCLWKETVELLKSRIFPKYNFEFKMDEDGTIWFKLVYVEKWRKHSGRGQKMLDQLLKTKRDIESRILTKEDLVFGGLIWFNSDGQKMDNIACAWWRLLRKTSSVNQYSFKHLRKTGANMISQISGSEEIAQTYLSHTPASVARQSYIDANYERLADALWKMRSELEPVFASVA